jgi:hypothetical protein
MRLRCGVRHALVLVPLAAASALVDPSAAQDSSAGIPPSVFAADAPLNLTIRTDLRALLSDRGENRRDHDGIARFARPDGSLDSIAVALRTRGIFRRRPSVCNFPPLRLTIRPRVARGTPFEGERRIKLVTHCRPSDEYEQYVLQEYLIYRVYALLTDLSLRTRLARITYEDATGKDKPITRYAILLEDERPLAERHRMRLASDTGTAIARLQPDHAVFVAVFQYFIGNTDFSVRGLHNVVLLEDSLDRIRMVPYDFDWAGVIGTRYAHPHPSLPIQTVQQRFYMGYCGLPDDFDQAFARFRQHRAAIEELYSLEPLERGHRERARRYYDDFFRLIDDPRRIRKEMLSRCH